MGGMLEVQSDGDLRSMQRKLIEEVDVAAVVIEISVTDLRKDVAGELVA